MIQPQFILPLARELIIDLFAGGGGASTGIEQAIGRHVDIAVNHSAEAVSLHQVNHPQTKHFVSDVFEVDPIAVTEGMPVGLLWASPDCKHFSKAKGGKPVSKKIRGLAWVVIKWAKLTRPRKIILENVEEFQTWGPLLENGRICPDRKGRTFRTWKRELQRLGGVVEHRELRAMDYGAPTTRKRLFVIVSFDGSPIVWPEPTHGKGLLPYRTAAECIDWSLPCPSIFERKKPLAEATERRIAHGIKRYVLDSAKPFIVPVTHPGDSRIHSVDSPLPTVTGANRGELALTAASIARIGQTGGNGTYVASAEAPLSTITTKAEHLVVSPVLVDAAHADVSPTGVKRWGQGHRSVEDPVPTVCASGGNSALAAATLVQTGYGEREGQAPRALDLEKPLGTVVGDQKHALVASFLAKHYGDRGQRPGSALSEPIGTVTSVDHYSLVAAHISKFRDGSVGSPADEPLHTVTAGGEQARPGTGNAMGLVIASLAKLRGTSNSADVDAPLHTVSAQGEHHALVISNLGNFNAGVGSAATADQAGIARDSTRRDDLEDGAQGQSTASPENYTKAGRDAIQARISASQNDLAGRPLSDSGSYRSVVDSEGSSAGGAGHQPRGRGEDKQSSQEPGANDSLKQPQACLSDGAAAASSGSHSEGLGHASQVRALLIKYFGTQQDPKLDEPMHTVTTKDRFALVVVFGVEYYIADIGMRMLQPRELFRAQGFDDSYIIDRGHDGRVMTKSAQVRLCGNSVCPPIARAIVAANYVEQDQRLAA